MSLRIPSWVYAALAAAVLGFLGWQQYRAVSAERDAAAAQLQTSQAEVAVLDSALRWRRDYSRRLEQALANREDALASAREEIRGHLDTLTRLEHENDELRAWLDSALPGPVADWLRQLAESPADGADPGDAGDTGQAD